MSEQEPYTPEECKPPYPIGTPKWAVWMQGKTEGIKVGRQLLDAELKSKDAEITRRGEALVEIQEYAMQMPAGCSDSYTEKDLENTSPSDMSYHLASIIYRIGKKALSPIESGDKCPKCGSTEDPWFSREVPMGYHCPKCGIER